MAEFHEYEPKRGAAYPVKVTISRAGRAHIVITPPTGWDKSTDWANKQADIIETALAEALPTIVYDLLCARMDSRLRRI